MLEVWSCRIRQKPPKPGDFYLHAGASRQSDWISPGKGWPCLLTWTYSTAWYIYSIFTVVTVWSRLQWFEWTYSSVGILETELTIFFRNDHDKVQSKKKIHEWEEKLPYMHLLLRPLINLSDVSEVEELSEAEFTDHTALEFFFSNVVLCFRGKSGKVHFWLKKTPFCILKKKSPSTSSFNLTLDTDMAIWSTKLIQN